MALQLYGQPSAKANCSAVFIVGLSRSGTTLLARMLDAHSEVAIFPETWCYVHLNQLGCMDEFRDEWQYILFLNGLWDVLASRSDPAGDVVASLGADRPRYVGPTRPILELLGSVYAKVRGASVWGEKTPAHILFLPEMRNLFPNARVLVTIRDPRDVLLSYDEAWGGNRRDSLFLMKSAAVVRHYLTQLRTIPGFPKEQTMLVRYEELTADPENVLKEICGFINIDFEPGMLNFHEQFAGRESPYTPYHQLLSKPVTTERVGRYRNEFSSDQIALIEEFLETEIRALGYPSGPVSGLQMTPRNVDAKAIGNKLYQQMRSGLLRRRARRKAQVRMAAYKWAGPLMAMRGKHLAVTSDDWAARVSILSGSRVITSTDKVQSQSTFEN